MELSATSHTMWSVSRRRVARARFESWFLGRWNSAVPHLGGSPATKSLVRSVLVVPAGEDEELGSHLRHLEGHENAPEALHLQRAHESLDHGDAAVLTDRAETGSDAFSVAPALVLGLELTPLVADEIARSYASRADRAIEHTTELRGCGLPREYFDVHDSPGEVILDHCDPPGERPRLSNRVSHPEPASPGPPSDEPHAFPVTVVPGAAQYPYRPELCETFASFLTQTNPVARQSSSQSQS